MFGELAAPIIRVGSLHAPIPHSPPLIEAIVPQHPDIEAAVLASVGRTAAAVR